MNDVQSSSRFHSDLRQFAETIKVTSFEALSPGIGLGEPRVAVPKPVKALFQSQNIAATSASALSVSGPSGPMAEGSLRGKRHLVNKAGRLGFGRTLLALSIDFVFVVVTLALALASATLMAAMKTGGVYEWIDLAPIQWLARFHPLEILAGVYGAAFLYLLLFKLLVGQTFGESFFAGRQESRARRLRG